MDNIGYTSLAHAAMLERAIDVTANNIANANTGGFRATRNTFEELVANIDKPDGTDQITYPYDRSYVDLSSGPLRETGNTYDVAIRGGAWFAYLTPDDAIALGRDGNLTAAPNGNLVTSAGNAILDAGGGPVIIPPGSGNITIAEDGTISNQEGGVIGQIGLFDEPEIESWLAASHGMFVPPDGDPLLVPSLTGAVAQGFTEGSNVNAVVEMTRMIEAQRAYERSMNFANAADELRKETLSRLGKPA